MRPSFNCTKTGATAPRQLESYVNIWVDGKAPGEDSQCGWLINQAACDGGCDIYERDRPVSLTWVVDSAAAKQREHAAMAFPVARGHSVSSNEKPQTELSGSPTLGSVVGCTPFVNLPAYNGFANVVAWLSPVDHI